MVAEDFSAANASRDGGARHDHIDARAVLSERLGELRRMMTAAQHAAQYRRAEEDVESTWGLALPFPQRVHDHVPAVR